MKNVNILISQIAQNFSDFHETVQRNVAKIFHSPRSARAARDFCWLEFLTDFDRYEIESDLLHFFGFSFPRNGIAENDFV